MAYPVAWRGSAASRAGSLSPSWGGQSPLAGRFGRPANLAPAANDFSLPVPANDNFPLGRAARFGRVAGRGARILWWVGAGLTLYELYQHMRPFGSPQFLRLGPAWTKSSDCGLAPDFAKYNQSYSVCSVAAPGLVISPGPDNMATGPAKAIILWQAMPPRYYLNGKDIYAFPSQKWSAFFSGVANQRTTASFGIPTGSVRPSPAPFPSLAPHLVPIQQPVAVPAPVPYTALPYVRYNPDVPSSTQLELGPRASSPSVPDAFTEAPYGEAVPVGDPGMGNPPSQAPGSSPEAGSDPLGDQATQLHPELIADVLPEHEYARPPKGTKERKGIINPAASLLVRRLFDAATETEDFVDALYQSIDPPKVGIKNGKAVLAYRRPRPTYWKDPLGNWHKRWPSLPEKVAFIYEHAGDINIGTAINTLAKNELKDRFFGKLGQTAGKAARAVHDAGVGSPSRSPTLTRAAGHF